MRSPVVSLLPLPLVFSLGHKLLEAHVVSKLLLVLLRIYHRELLHEHLIAVFGKVRRRQVLLFCFTCRGPHQLGLITHLFLLPISLFDALFYSVG